MAARNIFEAEFSMDSSDVERSFQDLQKTNSQYAESLKQTLQQMLKLKQGTQINQQHIQQLKEMLRIERERQSIRLQQNRQDELAQARSARERQRIIQDYADTQRMMREEQRLTDQSIARGTQYLQNTGQFASGGGPGAGQFIQAGARAVPGMGGQALGILGRGGGAGMIGLGLFGLAAGAVGSFLSTSWDKAVARDAALQPVLAASQGRYATEAGAITGSTTYIKETERQRVSEEASKVLSPAERAKLIEDQGYARRVRGSYGSSDARFVATEQDYKKLSELQLKQAAGKNLTSDEEKFLDRAKNAFGVERYSGWMALGGVIGQGEGAGYHAQTNAALRKEYDRLTSTKEAQDLLATSRKYSYFGIVPEAYRDKYTRLAAENLLKNGYTPDYQQFLKEGEKRGWTGQSQTFSSPSVAGVTTTIVDNAYNSQGVDRIISQMQEFDENVEKYNDAEQKGNAQRAELEKRRQSILEGIVDESAKNKFSEMGISDTDALKYVNAAIQANPNLQSRNTEGYHLAMYEKLGFGPDQIAGLNQFYDSGQRRTGGQVFSMLDRMFRNGQDFPVLKKYMDTFTQLLPQAISARTLQSGTETNQIAALMKNLEDTFLQYGHSVWTGKQQADAIQTMNESIKDQSNDWVEAFRYRANERIWNESVANPLSAESIFNKQSENYNAQLDKMRKMFGNEFNPFYNEVIAQQGIYTSPAFVEGMMNSLGQAFKGDPLALGYATQAAFAKGNAARAADIAMEIANGNSSAFTTRGGDYSNDYSEYDVYASQNQKYQAEKENLEATVGGQLLEAVGGIQSILMDIYDKLK